MLHTDDTDPQTVQEGYAALRELLGFNDPERPDAPKPSDLAVLKAAIKTLRDTKREQAGLTRLSDPAAPGWRDLDYEEPPQGYQEILLKTENGHIFIGTFHGYGEDEEGETIEDGEVKRDAPIFKEDNDLYDGDAPLFWSYLPTYDYDDLTSDADADTAKESDDSEVFYRDIGDPPPIGVSVLLLYKDSKEPFIGFRRKDFNTGEEFYQDTRDGDLDSPPDFWSYFPKLPNLDSEGSDS